VTRYEDYALDLADRSDGSSMNGGKPIAGIHPMMYEIAAALRVSTAAVETLRQVRYHADDWIGSEDERELFDAVDAQLARLDALTHDDPQGSSPEPGSGRGAGVSE
jgi:hypothetical protein